MALKVTPFLMFEGKAEEAAKFYVSLFGNSKIKSLEHWAAGEPGPEGAVKRAAITLDGQDVLCFDSPGKHEFSFTPSISMFVDCADENEIDRLFAALSEGGQVMMPLNAYPFAKKFAWVADRFGVSWQLSLV
jgi:predicted 3-demethylubiquinone-9 3-methyltransferase (glyoxalase superfamily)